MACAAAAGLLLAGCASPPPTPASVTVRLIAFNDFHGNLETTGLTLPWPDPAKPGQIASFVMGGPFSSSAADYSRHGLNLFMRGSVARVALPVQLAPPGPTFAPGGWLAGLARFEVDTAARTMRERPMVGGRNGNGDGNLSNERSLQIEDQVFYLGAGELSATTW